LVIQVIIIRASLLGQTRYRFVLCILGAILV